MGKWGGKGRKRRGKKGEEKEKREGERKDSTFGIPSEEDYEGSELRECDISV